MLPVIKDPEVSGFLYSVNLLVGVCPLWSWL